MNSRMTLWAPVLILLTVAALLQLETIPQVNAQRTAGVAVGNYAKYGNITVTWSSNDPNAQIDPSLTLANQTDWFKHTVTIADSAFISFENITQLKDGTRTTSYGWVDVTEGVGNASLMFISAFLGPSQSIYEGYPAYINETVARTYVGVPRATNHLNITISSQTETNPIQEITAVFNYYWDRNTGILTERLASFGNKTGSYITHWSRSDVMVDTNIWGVDTIPPIADAGNDITVRQNEAIVFNGSRSTDNFEIFSYEWDFGDNTTSIGETVTRSYSKPGTYKVVLTVRDVAGLTDTDTINVVVIEAPNNDTEQGFPYWIPIVALLALAGGGSVLFYNQKKAKSRIRRRRLTRYQT